MPIGAATAHQLLNILAEREHQGSTIVTFQFTPNEWYKSIPDAVIDKPILNRLVDGAEIITLHGPNMPLEANAEWVFMVYARVLLVAHHGVTKSAVLTIRLPGFQMKRTIGRRA